MLEQGMFEVSNTLTQRARSLVTESRVNHTPPLTVPRRKPMDVFTATCAADETVMLLLSALEPRGPANVHVGNETGAGVGGVVGVTVGAAVGVAVGVGVGVGGAGVWAAAKLSARAMKRTSSSLNCIMLLGTRNFLWTVHDLFSGKMLDNF